MNIKDDIRSVTYLKSHAAGILDFINETHRSMIITQNGEAKGVLLDPESYDKMRRALVLMKIIAHGEKDISDGKTVPQELLFAKVEKRLSGK